MKQKDNSMVHRPVTVKWTSDHTDTLWDCGHVQQHLRGCDPTFSSGANAIFVKGWERRWERWHGAKCLGVSSPPEDIKWHSQSRGLQMPCCISETKVSHHSQMNRFSRKCSISFNCVDLLYVENIFISSNFLRGIMVFSQHSWILRNIVPDEEVRSQKKSSSLSNFHLSS